MNFMLTPAVRSLLMINAASYLISAFIFPPLSGYFGLRYIFSANFYPFQLVTYMFLHADFMHLFFNMFALFMFGPIIERFWGTKRFITFYIVCGLGAGFIYSLATLYSMYDLQLAINAYISNPTPDTFTVFAKIYAEGSYYANIQFLNAFAENPDNENLVRESIRFVEDLFTRKSNIPMVGASGCVFGILMAFGLLFPQMELFIFPLPIPIKAWLYVAVYGVLELYQGVHAEDGDNVAHFAHIGGMIFAYILIRIWRNQDYKGHG